MSRCGFRRVYFIEAGPQFSFLCSFNFLRLFGALFGLSRTNMESVQPNTMCVRSSPARIVLLLLIITVAILEADFLLEPRNLMADPFRREERWAARRTWAATKTPESKLQLDHERALLSRHQEFALAVNLGVFLLIEAFLVYQFRRQAFPRRARLCGTEAD
jgi:hypothetical protein